MNGNVWGCALFVAAAMSGAGSTARAAPAIDASNPFFADSTLPFQAPPFDKIKDTDYEPAITAGMAAQLRELRAITTNHAPASFENTLVALENTGRMLERASAAFDVVTAANLNPVLKAAKTALAPQQASHHDAIYLDAKLFARLDAVYRQRGALALDAESMRLLEVTHDEFVRSGAQLSASDKQTLRRLNRELSTMRDQFENRILGATTAAALSSTTPAAFAGLSDAQLAAAAQSARERHAEGYVLPMQNTTRQPLAEALTVRATRQALLEASYGRAERGDANDTRALIPRMAQLRAQRAKLLGFPSHAAWSLANQMAKTPAAALAFMDALVPLATAQARREEADIQTVIDAEHGGFKAEVWDWDFYAQQVRKARFDLPPAEIKPYFELQNVLVNGVFFAAHQLYGLTFQERKDLPVYQADVRVFEVHDADGSPLALFYCDYFKRDNKQGGAWMSSLVAQSTLRGTKPVVYNVANLPKPAAGEPALISFDDVTTMFHEFGHALHGMFAATRYPSLSGTATARDFVEFPSQFNEHWAVYPEVFNHFATHYRTGAAMPAGLADKIRKAENFNEGYNLTELLAAAELDLRWHSLSADAPLQDADEFEKRALSATHLALRAVPPRYRSTYFSHIWSGGYAAGYYAYLWTEMLDDDAYGWFDEHGGLTRANGDRLRQMVLSRGNTEDLAQLYAAWRGRAPTVDALLKYRGLQGNTP